MKAVIRHRYGSPDVLAIEEVDPPTLTPDRVLVRVQAASVNAFDWHMLRGRPFMARIGEGLRRPKTTSLGVDVAGVVEAVGDAVTHLRVGDAVIGHRTGAFGELVSGATFVPKPNGLSWEEAASIPVAGVTALQAVRDHGRLEPGQRVLVTGAGGGVGTFAVQIAAAMGGRVTAVTSSPKLEVVRGLGAERVIDGSTGDFTRSERGYDVLIDVAGNRALGDLARVLTPDGTLVVVGAGRGDWIGPLVRMGSAIVRSRLGRRRFRSFLARITKDDLLALKTLIESGAVRPVVDRTYPLSEVAEAIRYVESGRACGKVAIMVSGE